VGHRRWVVYPQTQYMGTGDVPEGSGNGAANALWTQDSNLWGTRPATRDGFVAWPPPGYVPYQVVYARWSLSMKNANFSGATVSMTENGSPISVTVDQRMSVQNSAPENSIVWRPVNLADSYVWPKPSSDTAYAVNINNVVVGGSARNYSYTVRVFDPQTGGVVTPTPSIFANGSGGPITISRSTAVTVSVALNPGSYLSQNGDWFLWVNHGSIWYTYNLNGSFSPGTRTTYQGPLASLGTRTLFSVPSLPAGQFVVWFGVDTLMNGVRDTGKDYWDSVTVNVN
jgi:hypothetical protein